MLGSRGGGAAHGGEPPVTTPAELVAQQRASWEAEVSAKLADLLTRDDPKTAPCGAHYDAPLRQESPISGDGYEPGAPDGTTVGDCSTEDEREA